MSFLNVSNESCVTISCQNFAGQNARIFTNLYVDNKFASFANNCSYLLGVGTPQINNLNMSSINNLKNLNAGAINTSIITI